MACLWRQSLLFGFCHVFDMFARQQITDTYSRDADGILWETCCVFKEAKPHPMISAGFPYAPQVQLMLLPSHFGSVLCPSCCFVLCLAAPPLLMSGPYCSQDPALAWISKRIHLHPQCSKSIPSGWASIASVAALALIVFGCCAPQSDIGL